MTTAKHIFEGHTSAMGSVVFLHDNVHIVSGSDDGIMCKWDCDTGLLVGEPWKGEGSGIWALALSPDGKTIACGRVDGSLQMWNTGGKMTKGSWSGHSSWVQSLSWSPSGDHIASGSHDGTILIRKAENGEVEVGPINQEFVRGLAYSPSGDRIASGGHKIICIWDSNTGRPLVTMVGPGDLSSVASVMWSPDSSKLYSASGSVALVFDSTSGTELHHFEHTYWLHSIALSPEHNLLACVGSRGIAQLWSTESHQPLGQPFGEEDGRGLYFMSFSRDGQYLAHGGRDNKITLWMVKDIIHPPSQPTGYALMSRNVGVTQQETSYLNIDATDPFTRPGGDDTPLQRRPWEEASIMERATAKHEFKGHTSTILSFVFLHDNVHIVSGSEDGTMRKWNCDTGLLVGEPWKGEGRDIWVLALSPNGRRIACGREDGSVQMWNTKGKMIKGSWSGHSSWVQSLSWSPSGDHVASGSHDGTILIRKAENGEVEVGPIKTNQEFVRGLAYSPSGDRIASGGYKTICIWDSNTGKRLVGPIRGTSKTVTSVAWSPDGSKLYSASGYFAFVFDSISGEELHQFQHGRFPNSVSLSPKHDVLACVGYGGIAQLWSTESHQPLGQRFSQEDGDTLHCVSFSRDGRYLAYGGSDMTITLWMVQDIAPQLPVPASSINLQGVTQQETPPESPSSSCLNVDATTPFSQSAVNDITEQGRDNPYHNFFASSWSSLPSPSSDPSPRRRLWNIFFLPPLLYPPPNEFTRLQERLMPRFFSRRALSNSLVQASTNSRPTARTPKGKVGTETEERDNDVDPPECSANTTERDDDKSKQREEPIAHTQIPSADNIFSPDSDDNPKLWKLLMRARGKGDTSSKKSPAKLGHIPSSEVLKAHEDSVSQTDPSSHAGPAHTLTSLQMMSGQSSEPPRPSAARPSTIRHMWNTLIPSRYRPPVNESITLRPRSKRSIFSQHTGPRPVTIYAARPKKLYWRAPRTVLPANQSAEQGNGNGDGNGNGNGNANPNAQTVQSPSTVLHPPAAQADLGSHGMQSPQTQAATQTTPEAYDFGRWGNFCMAIWCIRPVVSTAQPATS